MVIFLRIRIRLRVIPLLFTSTTRCVVLSCVSALRMGENPPVRSRNLFCALGLSYQILVTLIFMNANALESLAETGTRWAHNDPFFLPPLLLQPLYPSPL